MANGNRHRHKAQQQDGRTALPACAHAGPDQHKSDIGRQHDRKHNQHRRRQREHTARREHRQQGTCPAHPADHRDLPMAELARVGRVYKTGEHGQPAVKAQEHQAQVPVPAQWPEDGQRRAFARHGNEHAARQAEQAEVKRRRFFPAPGKKQYGQHAQQRQAAKRPHIAHQTGLAPHLHLRTAAQLNAAHQPAAAVVEVGDMRHDVERATRVRQRHILLRDCGVRAVVVNARLALVRHLTAIDKHAHRAVLHRKSHAQV